MRNIRLFRFDKNEEAIIAACDTCHKCHLNICSNSDKYLYCVKKIGNGIILRLAKGPG